MLIASAIVSRDGFCIDARGALPAIPWSRALGDESLATLDRCTALLYGRIGWQRDRTFWTRPDAAESPTGRLLKRYPKLVCSTTLPDDDPGWNTTVIRDPAELATSSARLAIFGCPTLLARITDLVDEVRTIVTAQELGAGTRYPTIDLPLVETRDLGTAELRVYRRA